MMLPPETVQHGDIELSLRVGATREPGRQSMLATIVRPSITHALVPARDAAAAALDPLFLAATLAHGRPVRAEWDGGRLIDATGATPFGISGPIHVTAVRGPLAALSTYRAVATVIAAHPELAAAISRWRAALDYLWPDPSASMALTYLSVAVLVDHMKGHDTKTHWRTACVALGFDRDDIDHLYDSLQFGRHANWSDARGRIEATGRARLSAHDCCFRAADIIDAYRLQLA